MAAREADTAGTSCEITLNDCPNYTPYTGWSGIDSYHGTSSTKPECLRRAKDYLSWCGARLPVSATYWTDGQLVAQEVASPLDGHASTELLPAEAAGIENPMIQFANGEVVDGAPGLYPGYPNIPGFGPTPWFITQWKKWDHMQPDIMSRLYNSTLDPVLGLSNYSFSTQQYLSHAWFYPDPTDSVDGRRLVFELFSTGGVYDSAGGAGLHFSTGLTPAPTLDAPVFLTFNGKVKRRAAIYLDPNPDRSQPAGLWYSLFTATYIDPDTGRTTSAFVQILHADTRDRAPARYVDFYQFYDRTPATVNYLNLLAEDMPQYFPRASPKGALRPVQFDVAKYVCDMVKTRIPRSDGTWYTFPAAARTLSNWKLTSFATGVETSDRVMNAAGQTVAQGSVEISYQISGLHLKKYAGLSATYDGCAF